MADEIYYFPSLFWGILLIHHTDPARPKRGTVPDQRLVDGQKKGSHRILPLEIQRHQRPRAVLVSIRVGPRTRALLRTAHDLSGESVSRNQCENRMILISAMKIILSDEARWGKMGGRHNQGVKI